jgi:putative oligomerization/nucleic acid binding protein
MSRRTAPRALTLLAVVTMVVSLIGFVTTLILNAFVFDEYDAYGEVSIPGTSSLHLPAGDVTVSFHTVLIGSTSGGGLPVPPLKYRIASPDGLAEPELTEDYGTTTTVNNDARVRIGYLHVPTEGTYDITTDGNVSAFLDPRLAFGHGSSHGNLPIIFAVVFGLAVVDLVLARIWAARVRRSEFAAAPAWSSGGYVPPAYSPPPPMSAQPVDPYTPTDQGIRIEQLNTLARLRDSGALTESEYAAEKKRVLDGL